jgi:hypothetical protein
MSKVKITHAKDWDGEIVSASEAIGSGPYMFLACDYQVILYKKRKTHGPADHYEHILKRKCPLNHQTKTMKLTKEQQLRKQ